MNQGNKLARIVLLSAVAGFLAAVMLAGVSYYLSSHDMTPVSDPGFAARIAAYLWPTGILMMDANEDWGGVLLLPISATLNAIIYGFLGYSVYTVWSVLTGPEDKGWWPSTRDR